MYLVVNAQNEGVSPTYTFSIKKKIEPPVLTLVEGSLQFVDENNNGAIDAMETCSVVFELSNDGFGDALGLMAIVSMEGNTDGINVRDQRLDRVPLNETTLNSIPLEASRHTLEGKILLNIEITEPNGFGLSPFTLEINTLGFRSPEVSVVDYTITGSGTLEKKSPFDLQVLVQNIGLGDGKEVKVDLKIPNNVFCISGNENSNLGTMKPGDTESIIYTLIINQLYDGSEIPIEVKVTEEYGEYGHKWSHIFSLDQAMASSKLVVESKQREDKLVKRASLRSDVDKNIPISQVKNPHRYALVIGNEDYASRSTSLDPEVNVDYAVNDAVVMARYFEKSFGIPNEHIELLTDATTGEMKQAISRLMNIARAEQGKAELYFYYSGHGLPKAGTNEPFLIPVDVAGTSPELGISLDDLYQNLTSYPVEKVTVFLDACFSGGAKSDEELVAMKGMRVQPKKGAIPEPLVVFTSSSGNETSGVYREKQHGYFTYYLMKYLQESGAEVSYGSLFESIERNVDLTTAKLGSIQRPQVLAAPGLKEDWQIWRVGE